jgi:glucokinase
MSMAAQERVIGVDLGGTKILSGLIGPDGELGRRREWPTPVDSQESLLAALDAAVEDLRDPGVVALGFSIPSVIDQRAGRALSSVNVPLHDLEFRARMEARFDLPVGLDNDANAAAFAEWRVGAGADSATMVMLTLGTGVGGGFVLDGQLYRGWAEAGHMVVVHDGKPCGCGGRGHVEAYCTGVAAGEAAREVFGPAADAHRLVRLANEGDAQARELLAGIGRILGSAIGSLVNLFDAERVVIGGGFGNAAFDHLAEAALEVARREALPPADESLSIAKAELGTAAGVIGAGLIGFEARPS